MPTQSTFPYTKVFKKWLFCWSATRDKGFTSSVIRWITCEKQSKLHFPLLIILSSLIYSWRQWPFNSMQTRRQVTMSAFRTWDTQHKIHTSDTYSSQNSSHIHHILSISSNAYTKWMDETIGEFPRIWMNMNNCRNCELEVFIELHGQTKFQCDVLICFDNYFQSLKALYESNADACIRVLRHLSP